MSRVAKSPLILPSGVEVNINPGGSVSVKGPLGTLSHTFDSDVVLKRDGDIVLFAATNDSQQAGAMSGTGLRHLARQRVRDSRQSPYCRRT